MKLYPFNEAETEQELKSALIAELIGEELQQEIQHWANSIADVIKKENTSKLNQRGYVVLVNGAWGTGKTKACYALINEIKSKLPSEYQNVEVVSKSFLPFGDANDSIRVFLRDLGRKLYSFGWLDIRKDMEQTILEITPSQESDYQASLNLGFFSVSRNLKSPASKATDEKLYKSFKRLAKNRKTLVLLLDDVDRLHPDEIISVVRMIEKLKKLPRVIVLLPLFNKIASRAFVEELKLSPIDAPSFLRKLIDAEITIKNDLPQLKSIFIQDIQKSSEHLSGVVEFIWDSLLHILIIEEALLVYEAGGEVSVREIIDGTDSAYLGALRSAFIESNARNVREKLYPFLRDDNQGKRFEPIGAHYPEITSSRGNAASMSKLKELQGYGEAFRKIYQSPKLCEKLNPQHRLKTYEEAVNEHLLDDNTDTTLFDSLLSSILKDLNEDKLLTNNYSMRDIRVLASMIKGDLDPEILRAADFPEKLYKIVYRNFFRFKNSDY